MNFPASPGNQTSGSGSVKFGSSENIFIYSIETLRFCLNNLFGSHFINSLLFSIMQSIIFKKDFFLKFLEPAIININYNKRLSNFSDFRAAQYACSSCSKVIDNNIVMVTQYPATHLHYLHFFEFSRDWHRRHAICLPPDHRGVYLLIRPRPCFSGGLLGNL